MKRSPQCSCGLLPKWARDADTRITYDDSHGNFFLTLTDTLRLVLACCPSCGVHSEMSVVPGECSCGLLASWAGNPEIPICFNADFNEYYLKTLDEGSILFTHCPSCGGALPKSTRGEFFTEPSTSEMIRLRARLESATSVGQVLKLLGEPDERYGPIVSDPKKKEIYGMRDIRQGLRYTSLSSSLILSVQELEDGQIKMLFEGKPKGDMNEDC